MTEKIKIFTAFSGYDSQCLALKYLGLDFDLVGLSEIDRYAIAAHNLLFPQYEKRNFGDISKIDWLSVPDFDLFTYSFPCTDISIAGKQQGFSQGTGTRSSLLWECQRAILSKKPKYLLLENVPALLQQSFRPKFKEWLNFLTSCGYTNYTKILDAKDYNVPQSRKRVFVVSILGNERFYFPPKQRLSKCLKNILEDTVDDKYYLSDKLIKGFINHTIKHKEKGNGFIFKPKKPSDIANTITAHGQISATDNYISELVQHGNYLPDHKNFHNVQAGRIYDPKGISPTLLAVGPTPKFLIRERIRKLTPKECFRLMGVKDTDIQILMGGGISERQLYKMAGNSIVVDVLMAIFDRLFIHKRAIKNEQLKLF